MTGVVAVDVLTDAERAAITELRNYGYRDIADAPRGITVGARVCHWGERYYEAYTNGTGTVVAVLEKNPSSWVAAGWGKRDIELVVRTDRDRFGDGCIGRWADYHTRVVEPSERPSSVSFAPASGTGDGPPT